MTRTQIFSVYNKARKAARIGSIDRARTNRALGILLRNGELTRIDAVYHSTVKSCQCRDHRVTGKPCKHMIAKMILFRIEHPATVN